MFETMILESLYCVFIQTIIREWVFLLQTDGNTAALIEVVITAL